jgi:hypothetical protein
MSMENFVRLAEEPRPRQRRFLFRTCRCCNIQLSVQEWALSVLFVLSHIGILEWAEYGLRLKDQWDWEEVDVFAARLAGYFAFYYLGLIFLFVIRTSCFARPFTYEKSLNVHRWLGRLFLCSILVHGVLIARKSDAEISTGYGPIAALFFILVWLTSLGVIRRRHYNFFHFSHFLWIPAIVFLGLHGWQEQWKDVQNQPPEKKILDFHLFYALAPGLFLLGLDHIARFWSNSREVTLLHMSTHAEHTLLTLRRPGFKFLPGQHVFISIVSPPELPNTCWTRKEPKHPIMIMRPLHEEDEESGIIPPTNDEEFSLCLRDMGWGTWSHRVAEAAAKRDFDPPEVGGAVPGVTIKVEGPYGDHWDHWDLPSLRAVLLISGGIGITGHIALLQHLWALNAGSGFGPQHVMDEGNKLYPGLTKIIVHWTLRQHFFLAMFRPLFASLHSQRPLFEVHVHLTNGKPRDAEWQELCESLEGIVKITYARINLPSLYTSLTEELEQQLRYAPDSTYRVGVFSCCPPELAASVRSNTPTRSGRLTFDLHEQMFTW